MPSNNRPRIGLALGSGSARGWSHIGVIKSLQRAGYSPDIVCGTSIGALVGAVQAAGHLEWLEKWVRKLDWQGILALMDIRMSGGLIEGRRLLDFFRRHFVDEGIEKLAQPFACVATELETGREVWLRQGSVIDAVRASIALPGLFTPARYGDRLLVDGGLVNPVPVSLCRAMGADVVIAVDLNWDLIGRRSRSQPESKATIAPRSDGPSMLGVLTTSLNIMQVRITQSRLAGEPADVIIRPRLSDISAMDFNRAAQAIEQGEAATELVLSQIADML